MLDEYTVNADLEAAVGFKSGDIAIRYRTGIIGIGTITLKIEKDEIALVDKLLVVEEDWLERIPSMGGKPMPKLIETKISKNVSALVGHHDGRVEIVVALGLPWPLPKTKTIILKREDIPRIKYAIQRAAEWRDVPEHERFIRGEE